MIANQWVIYVNHFEIIDIFMYLRFPCKRASFRFFLRSKSRITLFPLIFLSRVDNVLLFLIPRTAHEYVWIRQTSFFRLLDLRFFLNWIISGNLAMITFIRNLELTVLNFDFRLLNLDFFRLLCLGFFILQLNQNFHRNHKTILKF